MATIFLDNFRGFSKTVIPLSSVNFLIGENSTGKSSLLALIHLLCSPEFWFSQNFNLPVYEFGGFRDIVSATAQDKKFFTIGFCRRIVGSKSKAFTPDCYLLSYKEREALPILDFVARTDGRNLLVVRSVEGQYKYLATDVSKELAGKDDRELFSFLFQERMHGADTFLDLPKNLPSKVGAVPIFAVLDMIGAEAKIRWEVEAPFAFPFPLLTPDLVWFAPIRTKPKRTYDGYGRQFSPEGEHTPYLLRKKLSTETPNTFRSAVEVFGKTSGLYHKVAIKRLGKDAAAPFELLIELMSKCPLRVNSVGYGVSQVLPIVVEMLARPKDSWFAIQQPEVHLHPKAQADLGDLIYQVAAVESKHFLVETHSDFTVNRFRMNFRRTPKYKIHAQILFFERTDGGNQVHFIPIRDDGEYPDDQPRSFRDFFLKEQLALLGE